jgi:DNA-binding LacI/PurR family transcriptional regulator
MPSEPSKPRPTLRSVAAAAGVSAMTVSLALRNHPRIPAATRVLVQRTAARLGYRPDPAVAKLMHHLRVRRKPAFQASISALTSIPEGAEEPYVADMIRSARRPADELGYGFTLFRCDDAPGALPALQRVLRTRGVEGVLLLPIATPRSVREQLDWNEFAVVTTTYGVLAPEFHRVVPHQFGNALQICQQLAQKGYRRIGLVLPAEHDLRVHHGFSAAVAWQNLIGGTEFVRPLIHAGVVAGADELTRWFKREKPDVIIAAGDRHCRPIAQQLGLRVPGRVGFVSANKAGRSLFAGIEEQPEEIGATAIELLAAMIQRGEKGIPAVPKVTMIDGRWIEGRSVRSAAGATKPISLG